MHEDAADEPVEGVKVPDGQAAQEVIPAYGW